MSDAKHPPESVTSFEFDLATPFFQQLLEVFESLSTAPLLLDQLAELPPHQGVYGLYRDDILVYFGKADNPLPNRLRDHFVKIAGRRNIVPSDMRFKGVYLAKTWGPLAPEAMMISHFRSQGLCEWNGNGFGPHDPGRRREQTNKPPEGFDAQYPINAEWRCEGIHAGSHEANALLQSIKTTLPFCFRYQTDNPRAFRRGSAAYNDRMIEVPDDAMPASELITHIAQELGPTWQATRFPSHIILYEEEESYTHGVRLNARRP